MRWLVKEEPENYSFSQFVKDGRTVWAGVRNPVAQKNLRSMTPGDEVFYYHTGKEKAVVGVAKVAGTPRPDPDDASGKLYVVDLVPVKALKAPVTLASVKAVKSFADFPLVRLPRLSVMPVTDAQWQWIAEQGKG
ncbi:MAG: EVE domain-containing protein [Vicinamibacterales bacterium]